MKDFKLENHIRKSELNYWELPIDDKFGEGLELVNEFGTPAFSWVSRDKNGYREVILRISSYGVDHYYGKLTSYGLNFTDDKTAVGRRSCSGAFLRGIPEIYSDFLKIQLRRPYGEGDEKHDKVHRRDRWLGYELGDLTMGFWTEDEVIETAKEVFKRLFTGKWKLVIESYRGDKDETVYLDEIP